MRLLIAGWQGQIARALVEIAAGDESVTALSVGRPALDLCTPSTIRSTFIATDPDVLINTAAYTGVDGAEEDEQAAFDLNCAGARAFAELAHRHDVPVLHLSTAYVFDGQSATAYSELDRPNPQSVYGRSKRAGELAVEEANPRHLILRTSWIHSPYGRNFVSNILQRASSEGSIEVVDDQRGNPTSALDLAPRCAQAGGARACGRRALGHLSHRRRGRGVVV